MKVIRLLFGPLYWIAGRVFAVWARPSIQPEQPSDLITDASAEVCYVLESGGLADTLALEQACSKHGLLSPTASLVFGDADESSSSFNQGNCEIARKLFASQDGVTAQFWCEPR